METIEDIVRVMRAVDYGIIENPFVKFANCIEAAAKELTDENARLRSFVEELLNAASRECATCNYDCGPHRENCIYTQAAKFLEQKEVKG